MKTTISTAGAGADAVARNSGKINRQVTFKNCALFTDCIRKLNDIEVEYTFRI